MASRAERFKKTAIKAAKTAKKWAETAAKEADRLLAEAQKRAETDERRMRMKAALRRTGQGLKGVARRSWRLLPRASRRRARRAAPASSAKRSARRRSHSAPAHASTGAPSPDSLIGAPVARWEGRRTSCPP